MNDASNVSERKKQIVPWLLLALSIVLFGVLMAVRGEIPSIWVRALLAAVAFVFLFAAVLRFRDRS